jgi:hypothetical protein
MEDCKAAAVLDAATPAEKKRSRVHAKVSQTPLQVSCPLEQSFARCICLFQDRIKSPIAQCRAAKPCAVKPAAVNTKGTAATATTPTTNAAARPDMAESILMSGGRGVLKFTVLARLPENKLVKLTANCRNKMSLSLSLSHKY